MAPLDPVPFVAGFTVLHIVTYVLAGLVVYPFSGSIYTGDDRVLSFMRDVSRDEENRRWMRLVLPTQVVRGGLMAVVLVPLLDAIAGLSTLLQVGFLFGLLVVYTDVASATPFANNIEGILFLKEEFISPAVFLAIQVEAVVYAGLFAGLGSWLLV